MEIKTCKYCSKEFTRPMRLGKKLWEKRMFCSRPCVDNYQRSFGGWTYKTGFAKCTECGGDMSYRPGYTKLKHVTRRICQNCRSSDKTPIGKEHFNYKNYLEKKVFITTSETWSKRIKNRDGWKCVVCGESEKLESNHILPRKDYPEKSLELENGVTLCRECHGLFHSSWIGFSYPYTTS